MTCSFSNIRYSMFMPSKLKKFTLISLGALMLLGLALAEPAPAKPSVSWTPRSVHETLVAGDSRSFPVAFTPSRPLGDIEIRIVPELSEIVSVDPVTFKDVLKGQRINLTITISPSADLYPALLDGVIQLRQIGHPPKTLSRPLPLAIEVVWPTYESQIGFSVSYPPGFSAVERPLARKLLFHESQESAVAGVAPAFFVHIDPLGNQPSLHEHIRSFGITEDDIEEVFINGRLYLRSRESLGDSMEAISFGTLLNQDQVISVTALSSSFAKSQDFLQVISSLELDH